MEENDLLKPKELAEKLRVGVCWVYARSRVRKPDGIPVFRCGKHLRFRLEDVLGWIKKQNEEPR